MPSLARALRSLAAASLVAFLSITTLVATPFAFLLAYEAGLVVTWLWDPVLWAPLDLTNQKDVQDIKAYAQRHSIKLHQGEFERIADKQPGTLLGKGGMHNGTISYEDLDIGPQTLMLYQHAGEDFLFIAPIPLDADTRTCILQPLGFCIAGYAFLYTQPWELRYKHDPPWQFSIPRGYERLRHDWPPNQG